MTWWRRVELPTWGLLFVIYGGFAVITLTYHALPWWLVAPLGGWFVCWHGQLQHEHLHGHPTRWPWLNGLLVAPSLGLWLPYLRYRRQHLAHHRAEVLTDPDTDNESHYVRADRWAGLPRAVQWLYWANQTLAGRMLLSPILIVLPWLWREGRQLRQPAVLTAWLLHGIALAPLIWWIVAVCGISLSAYILLFAWPGLALTTIRSFGEHRAAAPPSRDSVIVRPGGALGLLFLNNNLHAVHHDSPRAVWFDLPALFAAKQADYTDPATAFVVDGYATWFRRYFVRPKDSPVYPGQPRRGYRDRPGAGSSA